MDIEEHDPALTDPGLTYEERIDEFLRLLGQGCTVRQASAAVVIPFGQLYAIRKRDEAFAKRWDDAKRIKVGNLIEEAERRAMKGSDKLLMFLLTNYAPDKFKSTSSRLEVSNPDGSLVLSESEKAARLAAILDAAKARKENPAPDGSDLV